MKNITILISLVLMGSNVLAKELVDGYILMSNNDTIKCKIKVPKSLALFDKVSIQDSLGKEQTYKARSIDINGFGFFYKGKKYDYTLILDDRAGAQFLMRVLENTAKRTVRVTGSVFSSYKKKIKAFLKDDPAMVDLFENTVSGITDMEKFVKQANSLQSK